MEILFQANTVYQLMVAIQIRNEMFSDDNASIIISDIMNDCFDIKERLVKSKIFDNVILQEIKNNKYSKISKIFPTKFIFEKITNIKENEIKSYNMFFYSNPSFSNMMICDYLFKKNKKVIFNNYEDGLSTYSKHWEKYVYKNSKNFKSLFCKNRYLKKISSYYVFSNKYFVWKPNKKIVIIPKLSNGESLEIINYVFKYNNDSFPIDCKTIFFEEGYFGDGKKVNDLEIINYCIKKFGQNGFYVKCHPRNRINRFVDMNIKTFPSMSIPWELIVINNIDRISDITLITIASASIFTPLLLFDIKAESYSCVKMINDKKYLFDFIPDVERKIIEDCDNITYLNGDEIYEKIKN